MYIYIYIYIYRIIKKKNFQKNFRLLPLSIYLRKTATISKYLQFLIYKLNESAVRTKRSTNSKLGTKKV